MAIMDRKEKVFVVKNISHLKENLMFLSKSKENVILLDSNNKKMIMNLSFLTVKSVS